jgi:hypothetical protein
MDEKGKESPREEIQVCGEREVVPFASVAG